MNRITATLWPVVDQGCLSIASFGIALALARFASPTEYGIFALLFSIILLINNVQYGLFQFPLIAGYPTLSKEEQRALTTSSFMFSQMYAVIVGSVLFLMALILEYSWQVGLSAFAAAWIWQLQSQFRSILIAQREIARAVPGDLAVGIIVVVLAVSLGFSNSLDAYRGFMVLAVAFGIGAAIQLLSVHRAFRIQKTPSVSFRSLWTTGKWVVVGSFIGGSSLSIIVVLLGILKNPTAVANYQAAANLLGATHPLVLSLGLFVIPAVAAEKAGANSFSWYFSWRLIAPLTILQSSYILLMLIFPQRALELIYGGDSPFVAEYQTLRVIAIGYAFFLLGSALVHALNGVGATHHGMAAQAGALVASTVIGIVTISLWSAMGAAVALFCCFTVQFLIAFAGWNSVIRKATLMPQVA